MVNLPLAIAEANKVRSLMEALMMVDHEPTIQATPNEFFVRAVNVPNNFTVRVDLCSSWFRYYSTTTRCCIARIGDLQGLGTPLEDPVVTHLCFYKDDAMSTSARAHFVTNMGISLRGTRFFGYHVKVPVGKSPWPEDRAIEDHKFNVQIHPQDLIHLLEHAIHSNNGAACIHITESKVTLIIAGENARMRALQVRDSTVIGNTSCRIKYDPTRGIQAQPSSVRSPNTFSLPARIEQTIQLPPSTYKPLLRAVVLAELVFLHFTHNEDATPTAYVPPVFRCVLAGEGRASTFYFILPHTPFRFRASS